MSGDGALASEGICTGKQLSLSAQAKMVSTEACGLNRCRAMSLIMIALPSQKYNWQVSELVPVHTLGKQIFFN